MYTSFHDFTYATKKGDRSIVALIRRVFFKIGVQFAFFQSLGKYDIERRMLKKVDKGDANSRESLFKETGANKVWATCLRRINL